MKKAALVFALLLAIIAGPLVYAQQVSGGASCSTATTSSLGCVKPDGSTITISGGVISSTSTGGGGGSVAINATTTATALYPLLATNTSAAASTVYIDKASPMQYVPSTGAYSFLGLTTTSLTLAATTTGALTTNGAGVVSSGTLGNSFLTNSSMTIAGHSVSLGGTQTIACSDLSNGATGCSTATGTSGATIPLLNGTNTWSGAQTHNGNIILGTGILSSPINGIQLVGSSTGYTQFSSANSGATNYTITFPAATGTVALTSGVVSSFSGDGALITNSGSTGAVTATLGTTANLTVNSLVDTTTMGLGQSLAFTSTTGTAPTNGIYSSAANTLQVTTSGSTALAISTTQSVGIGTTSPKYAVDVEIGANSNTTALFLGSTTSAGTALAIGGSGTGVDTWDLLAQGASNTASHIFGFYDATANKTPFAVNGNANQLIVAANTVICSGNTNNFASVSCDTGFSRDSAGVWDVGTGGVASKAGSMNLTSLTASGSITNTGITTDATHTDATVCEDTTSHQFYFGSGTAGICLGTSSLRYKRDVKPVIDGLAQINSLKPINFFYRNGHGDNGAKEQYGFLAEDVVHVLPKLTGIDSDGKPNSVDLLGMVPILVKAVQEQQAEIDDLKKKLRQ